MKFWLCLIVSHNKILCSKLKIFQDENVRMNEGAKENIWSLRKLKLKCSQCYCTLLKLRQLVCVFQVSIFFFLGSKGKKRKVKMSRLKQLTSKTKSTEKRILRGSFSLCAWCYILVRRVCFVAQQCQTLIYLEFKNYSNTHLSNQ